MAHYFGVASSSPAHVPWLEEPPEHVESRWENLGMWSRDAEETSIFNVLENGGNDGNGESGINVSALMISSRSIAVRVLSFFMVAMIVAAMFDFDCNHAGLDCGYFVRTDYTALVR